MKKCWSLVIIFIAYFAAKSFGQANFVVFPKMTWDLEQRFIFQTIATHYLTGYTEANVHYFLMNTRMEYLDDSDRPIREHTYKGTVRSHLLTIKPGLNFIAFCNAVKNIKTENLYKQIIDCQDSLKNEHIDDFTKHYFLLKLGHLIGDAHQPLQIVITTDHASASEQDSFDVKELGIPKMWDSVLTNRSRVAGLERVTLYDTVSPKQIEKLQADPVLKWLYESYRLRAELNQHTTQIVLPDKQYTHRYFLTTQTRMVQAGVRLAGVLNDLYKYHPRKDPYDEPDRASQGLDYPNDLSKIYGNNVTLSGNVSNFKVTDTTTVLEVKHMYDKGPNTIIVVLRGEARRHPKDIFKKEISITGKIIKINGKPGMEISKPNRLNVIVTFNCVGG